MKKLLFVAFAGAVAGLISPFFAGSLVWMIRSLNDLWGGFLIFAPVIGFWIVGFFARISPLILGTGVNSYKDEAVRIRPVDLALKYFSTSVTLGFGGSGGLVSPILFMGKGISELFVRKGERTFSIAFAAGMLTFYLGAPLSAALLSVEYFEKDKVSYEDLMPAFLASTISYYNYRLLGFEPIFLNALNIGQLPHVSTREVLTAFALAPIFGGFGMLIYFLKVLYGRFSGRLSPLQKTILSGLLVSLVGIIFGRNVLGLKIVYGEKEHLFIAGKVMATVFTIESMGSSGYFTPLTVIGVNLGYLLSPLGLNAQIGAIVGISALLSSMLNVPIAAVLFPMELFGHGALIPAAIGSSVAYMLYKRFRLE